MKSMLFVLFTITLTEFATSLPLSGTNHHERSHTNEIQDTRRLLGILKRLDTVREIGTSTQEEAREADTDGFDKRFARIPMVPYKRGARIPIVPYKRGRAPIVPYKRRAPYVPYKRDQDLSQTDLMPPFSKDIDAGTEDNKSAVEENRQGEYEDQDRVLSALKELLNYAYPSD